MTHQPIAHSTLIKCIERFIFNTRWILILFYLGLVVVLFLYGYCYSKDMVEKFLQISTYNMDAMKVIALDFIDVTMIANLIIMIIVGSYNSFVSRDHGYQNANISSGMLKIKISTSIIVVASIHLLKSFIDNKSAIDWDLMIKQLDIYGAFLVSAIVLGVLEYMHVKADVEEQRLHHELEQKSGH